MQKRQRLLNTGVGQRRQFCHCLLHGGEPAEVAPDNTQPVTMTEAAQTGGQLIAIFTGSTVGGQGGAELSGAQFSIEFTALLQGG